MEWCNCVDIYAKREKKSRHNIIDTISQFALSFNFIRFDDARAEPKLHSVSFNLCLFLSLSLVFFPILVCHSVHMHTASKSINHKLLKWNVSALTLCHRYTSCEHLVLQLHAYTSRHLLLFSSLQLCTICAHLLACTQFDWIFVAYCMAWDWWCFRTFVANISHWRHTSIHTKRKPSNSLGST